MFEELKYSKGKLYRNGKEAGWLGKNGYRYLCYKGKKYLTHRVIWFIHNKEWPKNNIDHINRVPTDNRIENLRDVTQVVNCHNAIKPLKSNKTSKVRGVHKHSKQDCWIAQITIKGQVKHLGSFKDINQAEAAYLAAKATVK